jgi:alkylation response protein AidB-like acyl-CoA dehydrogenase
MEAGVRRWLQPRRRRIWELEKRRFHVPWVTSGTTAMIARSEKFGSPELKAEVMPRVFSGDVRFALATEPEGGSTPRRATPVRYAMETAG